MKKLILAIGLFWAYEAAAFARPLYVITAKDSSISDLSRDQVLNVWLGYPTYIDDTKIAGMDYQTKSKNFAIFREKILGKTEAEWFTFFSRYGLAGKRSIPATDIQSEKEMVAYLNRNKNVIGYVFDKNLADTSKIVAVIDF